MDNEQTTIAPLPSVGSLTQSDDRAIRLSVSSYRVRYYQSHHDERKQYQKKYYEMNKDKIKEYYSKEEIKAKRAEYMRAYRAKKKIS